MSISLTGSGPSIELTGSGSSITLTVTTGGGSSGGVTDHGLLTGLSDDDHTQYHNDTRGDARYLLQSNDLSDVDDAAAARTNLGLGDSATLDVGTGSGDVAAGDAPASAVSTHSADTTSVHGIADTGDLVTGPASAMDSAIALFDGTGGKALKDSAVAISTDGTLSSDSDSLVPTEQAVKEYVDEALAVLDGLDDDFAALEAADWTLLGITVTGDVTISTLETALGSGGVGAGLYLSLGLPSLVSAFVGFAALYPGGTVTGGDPGLYQWDGGNLNFVRAIEPGDKFITARACDEDFTTVGGHGPVAQTVTVNLGSGDETVIGSSVIGASVVEYDNSTSGLTAEQVQDAIDELADEKADGPASATDSAIALFDGTEGKTLKDSAVAISTDGTLSSDSDSLVPTEQAVKEYVDANAGGSLDELQVVLVTEVFAR